MTPRAHDHDIHDERSTWARIRDAALQQFAELGYKEATIRGIGAAAGLSAGAVQRHFPTKEALRAACDAHVLDRMEQLKGPEARQAALDPSRMSALLATTVHDIRSFGGYVIRSLTSDMPLAPALFEQFVGFNLDYFLDDEIGPGLPDTAETRDLAAVFAAMQLGPAVLQPQLLRFMDADAGDPLGFVRIARARFSLMPGHLISDELRARMQDGLTAFQRQMATTDPGASPPADQDAPTKEHDDG